MKEKTVLEYWGLNPQPKGEVGVEIEMEGRNLPNSVPMWDVHEDGSLRGHAREYVFAGPQPRTRVGLLLDALQQYFKEFKSVLNPSNRCGVHVHINCQELTQRQVLNMICLYLVFEDLLVKWCGADREGNMFCLRTKDADGLLEALRTCCKSGSFNSMMNDNYRYSSMNIISLAKYGSLEFRALQTPKDFKIIKQWVSMLLRVKDESQKFETPQLIVESMSSNGAIPFLYNVFDSHAERLYCKGASGLIMEGMRRAQELAYTPWNLSKGKKKGKAAQADFDEVDAIVEAAREPRFIAPLGRARRVGGAFQPVPPDPPRPGAINFIDNAQIAWNEPPPEDF